VNSMQSNLPSNVGLRANDRVRYFLVYFQFHHVCDLISTRLDHNKFVVPLLELSEERISTLCIPTVNIAKNSKNKNVLIVK